MLSLDTPKDIKIKEAMLTKEVPRNFKIFCKALFSAIKTDFGKAMNWALKQRGSPDIVSPEGSRSRGTSSSNDSSDSAVASRSFVPLVRGNSKTHRATQILSNFNGIPGRHFGCQEAASSSH